MPAPAFRYRGANLNFEKNIAYLEVYDFIKSEAEINDISNSTDAKRNLTE